MKKLENLAMTGFAGGGGQNNLSLQADPDSKESQHYDTRKSNEICHSEGYSPKNLLSEENPPLQGGKIHPRPLRERVPEGRVRGKAAFTLAEVLITLGIIGVVAAMTLPGLIAKYDKQVATTRLKKFYSTYSQAYKLSVNEFTTLNDTSILTAGGNPDQMLAWYDKYLKPYLKTGKVEKTNVGIEVAFLDGSGMLIAKSSAGSDGTAIGAVNTHILYCVNLKYCDKEGIKDNKELHNLPDAKHTFLFYLGGVPSEVYTYNEETGMYDRNNSPNREEALTSCQRQVRNCTRLLLMDGWEFKDDYPRW